MPNRIIRESALASASLAELSGDEERLWWRLTIVADDFGRFDADPAIVASRCFPRWRTLKAARVERWLQALVAVGGVLLYQVDGSSYGVFIHWDIHQRIRSAKSKFPAPPDDIGQFDTLFSRRAISVDLRKAVFNRDKHCLSCGSIEELVCDHIVPVVRGGEPSLENLQTLCTDCNHAKYTKTLNFLSPGHAEKQFGRARRTLQRIAATCSESQQNAPVVVIDSKRERERDTKPIKIGNNLPLPPLAVLWNEIVKAPAVLRVSGTRADHLRARLGVYPDLDWWRGVLERIVASPFLRGKNDRGWAADFDWLIRNDENPARVLEGKYDTKRQVDPPPPPRAAIQDLPALPPEEAAANIRRIGEMVRQVGARKTL